MITAEVVRREFDFPPYGQATLTVVAYDRDGVTGALTFLQTDVQMDSYAPALFAVLVALERTAAYFRRGGPGRLLAAGFALSLQGRHR